MVRFRLHGVSFCFVGCHLSAHDYNVERRVKEYETILENIDLKFDVPKILHHE